ncbi:MAG TPA: TetR/AcrR family transcriptional regulator [Amycolatopsis sp.]|uniref:TetR/AcrR family transcriptional regulator n=1 Tax=Amycolatopsis sp. TaxID=37632 RepID=UPI002B46D190|nr:TetR/AcrR family transcriptional regulator [Amycolatopsis sp.]HKS49969.1 TetR/AcrR family transcriptional regulator [Amycolatopsis sp.]
MTQPGPARAPRGRPRSERVRLAVLDATADLLTEGGLPAATIERIAARAGVSKATIYKWWPTRGHVVLDSFFTRTRDTIAVDPDASLADSLTAQLDALSALFRDTPLGRLMRELAAVAQGDADVRDALEKRWLRPRRAVTVRLLREAAERGELRAEIDLEVVADQLWAPIYHRLLFGHAPLRDGLAADLVGQLLTGLLPRR